MYVVDGGSGMFDAQGCSSAGIMCCLPSLFKLPAQSFELCLVANEGTDPATVVVPT